MTQWLVGLAVAAYLHAHTDAFLHAQTLSTVLYLVLIVTAAFTTFVFLTSAFSGD